MTMTEFREIQDFNHQLMQQITELERQAFEAIGDPEAFDRLSARIDSLQASYKPYTAQYQGGH